MHLNPKHASGRDGKKHTDAPSGANEEAQTRPAICIGKRESNPFEGKACEDTKQQGGAAVNFDFSNAKHAKIRNAKTSDTSQKLGSPLSAKSLPLQVVGIMHQKQRSERQERLVGAV
jgi:hypothetical protein